MLGDELVIAFFSPRKLFWKIFHFGVLGVLEHWTEKWEEMEKKKLFKFSFWACMG